MSRLLYSLLFRILGVGQLFRDVVQVDRHENVKAGIRRELQRLLSKVDTDNPYFRGKYTDFLRENNAVDDETFLESFSKLPTLTKKDYSQAGLTVMPEALSDVDPAQWELKVAGKPFQSIRRLRRGNYLMPMATGGSSSLPLVVHMTKHHMFSMLFTFFKCWHRMGWRPGDKLLIFYPRNTYNIDDMVTFNRWSWLTGFKYHLFDRVDEATARGLVKDINRFRPKLLLVFPSPMNMIAHTIRKLRLPLDHHPELINVSGETFFDCQRMNIESVFTRSKIEDSYGSVELGEIAHQIDQGLEIFANVAYVETQPNEESRNEMIVTRLGLTDFPFIRYRMRDVADVEFRTDPDGRQRFVITRIEGKDSNHILSAAGQRFFPSFFNLLVNQLNANCGNEIVEIKVFERGQRELEIQFITRGKSHQSSIRRQCESLLREAMGGGMRLDIRFVEFIDHDYRRKYRVIERLGDIEFAGGIVGDESKRETVLEIEAQSARLPSPSA